jgi:light-regulated signal transduction histidine kinase (bacteriophytochrome)
VSHDLRAPLRHIDGYGSILEEDYAERIGEAGGQYIRKMRHATDRMGQLIDALLQLSRIGRSELQISRVDFSRMVADILAELQAAQPERQVELRIEEGVEIMADPRLIRIVADNLLGNAWKYSSTRETSVISFGRVVKDGKPCLFVADNGVGFDMAYVDKLFGAFQRLHGVDEFEGSGVGLATVQRIITRHGGTIWAEAAVDEGATFYFTLPLAS